MEAIADLYQVLVAEFTGSTELVVFGRSRPLSERLVEISRAQDWVCMLRVRGHGFLRTSACWTGPVWNLVRQPGTQTIQADVQIRTDA